MTESSDRIFDVVPAPWTPIVCEAREGKISLGLWNRTCEFRNTLLPSSLKTGGVELLAEPIRLVAFSEGKTLSWEEPDASLWRAGDAEVLLHAGAQVRKQDFWVNLNLRMEFDGLLRCDLVVAPFLRFAPEGCRPRLDGLWLEIPLRPEFAALFTYWPVNAGGAVQCNRPVNSGALPETGLVLPFKPFLWLGNEDGGLSFVAESDLHWQPANPACAMEVVRQPGAVVLRVRLLDSAPAAWQGKADFWGAALPPLVFTFGLQATPVKPMPADFHERRISQLDYGKALASYQIEKTHVDPASTETVLDRIAARGVRVAALHEKWTDLQNYWDTNRREEIKATVAVCGERGIKVIPYLGYELSSRAPEWAEVADRVVVKDTVGNYQGGWLRGPIQRDYMVCFNSQWQDRWLEGVAWMLDEYGFAGVYLDATPMPWGCANAAHGCGCVGADGTRRLTYPVFALRRMFQRLYAICGARGAIIDVHQSSCCITPVLAFCHSYWDGEHIGGQVGEAGKLDGALATFRAEFMGRNFGIPCEFLATGNPKAVGLALLHNVLVRPDYGELLDAVAPVWQALSRFGVGEAAWHPYWSNSDLVEVAPPSVKASMYLHRTGAELDRSLLILANLDSENTVESDVRLSATAAPAGETSLTDAINSERLACADGRLRVSLPPSSFRLITVQSLRGRAAGSSDGTEPTT